jgi:hypothetical protein
VAVNPQVVFPTPREPKRQNQDWASSFPQWSLNLAQSYFKRGVRLNVCLSVAFCMAIYWLIVKGLFGPDEIEAMPGAY